MTLWKRDVVPGEIVFSFWYTLKIMGLLWTNAILFYILITIVIIYIAFSFLLFIVSRKKLITYFKSNGNLPANFEPEKKGIKLAHPNPLNKAIWLDRKKSLHMLSIAILLTVSPTVMITLAFVMSYIRDEEEVHYGVVSIVSIIWVAFPLYICKTLSSVYKGHQDNYQLKSRDITVGLYFFLIIFFGTMRLPQDPHIIDVVEMITTYVSLVAVSSVSIMNTKYRANNRFILTSGLAPDYEKNDM